ncbi:MAG: RimK family alpha-L-glutamate ligase [Syntrophobacteria bacterium]
MRRLRVAIGGQLKACSRVITLGVRSQMSDYSMGERGLLRAADVIFYPTTRFVDIFATLGKETFPSVNCYRLLGNKLKQTALLRLLNVPHPRTRVYYGNKQKTLISQDFTFPLVAKRPFRSSGERHVFLIRDQEQLDWFNRRFNPAYIQEYVPGGRELRVHILNYRAVVGYWGSPGSELDEIPPETVSLARYIACAAELSDVAVDMIFDGSSFWVLELNFRHGDRGWLQRGQSRRELIMEMIETGEL